MKKFVVLALSLALVALGLTACKRAPKEVAPVKAGDFFQYHFAGGPGSYDAKILVGAGKGSDSFVVSAQPDGGEQPVEVDLALDSGKRIKLHYLGQLWLPPAHRVVGATTRAGAVTGQRKVGRFGECWVVEDYATKGVFMFHPVTGFLVRATVRLGNSEQVAELTSSSIDGLVTP